MKTDEPIKSGFEGNEGNTLFIFGNGLDINHGFPTSFKDSFQSDLFSARRLFFVI